MEVLISVCYLVVNICFCFLLFLNYNDIWEWYTLLLFASIGHFIVLSWEFINFSRFSLSTMLVFHLRSSHLNINTDSLLCIQFFHFQSMWLWLGTKLLRQCFPWSKLRMLGQSVFSFLHVIFIIKLKLCHFSL